MRQTFESTSSTLLEQLGADDHGAWQQLDVRYRAIIVASGERHGLNCADAADAAQETLVSVYEAYRAGKYDRSRGRLCHWVMGIARNRIVDVQRARARTNRAHRNGMNEMPRPDSIDPADFEPIWREAMREHIFRRALEELRERSHAERRTLEAFERYVIAQRPAAEVAASLGMTVNNVHLAKHRCVKAMREIVREIELEYGADDG